MKNTDRIFVCSNDSHHSRAAIIWAAKRSVETGQPLVIVHVVDDRWMAEPHPWIGSLRKMGEEMLAATEIQAKEAHPSVDVTLMLLQGSVSGSLRTASKEAALMVIGAGSSTATGAHRALQVAASAHCPVAVISADLQDAGRHGIVVGVDGSAESSQAVRFAATEANRTGQDLTIVYALTGTDRWIRTRLPESDMADLVLDEERIVLAESAAGLRQDFPDLTVHLTLETDLDPAPALVTAAATAQLLVLGSRGRGGFKRLLLGSTAGAVLHTIPCPTILTRTNTKKHE